MKVSVPWMAKTTFQRPSWVRPPPWLKPKEFWLGGGQQGRTCLHLPGCLSEKPLCDVQASSNEAAGRNGEGEQGYTTTTTRTPTGLSGATWNRHAFRWVLAVLHCRGKDASFVAQKSDIVQKTEQISDRTALTESLRWKIWKTLAQKSETSLTEVAFKKPSLCVYTPNFEVVLNTNTNFGMMWKWLTKPVRKKNFCPDEHLAVGDFAQEQITIFAHTVESQETHFYWESCDLKANEHKGEFLQWGACTLTQLVVTNACCLILLVLFVVNSSSAQQESCRQNL